MRKKNDQRSLQGWLISLLIVVLVIALLAANRIWTDWRFSWPTFAHLNSIQTDLSTVVIQLETVQRLFHTKDWASSVSGETNFERWNSDKALLTSLAQSGEVHIYYNAYYQKDRCQPPFCAISSTALVFPDPASAREALEAIYTSNRIALTNTREFQENSDVYSGRCFCYLWTH